MSDVNVGRIRFEWWCQCAHCGFEESGAGRWVTAVKALRTLGWRHLKGDGWVCPRCVANEASR